MGRLLSGVWRGRGIIGAALVALLLLPGCSALRLGYGQLPMLSFWWIDGYVGFDAAQTRRVREELRRWVEWHQQTQLSTYAAFVARVHGESVLPVTGAQVCRLNDAMRALLEPALERALPAAAAIVATLTPQQLDNIDARYRKRTDEMREDMLQRDLQERRKAAVQRAIKRFESFYGRLDDEQQRLVENGVAASPFDTQDWFAQRDQRHREMLETLGAVAREGHAAVPAQERLRALVRRFDGRSPIGPPQQAAALAAYNCELTARLHNTTTPAQRRHLNDKLAGWEADLRALAAQPAAAGPRDAAFSAPP